MWISGLPPRKDFQGRTLPISWAFIRTITATTNTDSPVGSGSTAREPLQVKKNSGETKISVALWVTFHWQSESRLTESSPQRVTRSFVAFGAEHSALGKVAGPLHGILNTVSVTKFPFAFLRSQNARSSGYVLDNPQSTTIRPSPPLARANDGRFTLQIRCSSVQSGVPLSKWRELAQKTSECCGKLHRQNQAIWSTGHLGFCGGFLPASCHLCSGRDRISSMTALTAAAFSAFPDSAACLVISRACGISF